MKDDLVAVDSAATHFHLSRATLFRLVKAGRLKSFKKLGDRRTLVSKAAVERLLGPRRKK